MDSARFSCMQSQSTNIVITTVTTNPTRADRPSITIHQFYLHAIIHVRYILSFFSKEKITYQNLRASHTYYTSSFPVLVQKTRAISLCSFFSSFHLLILTPEPVLLIWKMSLCMLWQVWSRASSRLWRWFIHRELVRFISPQTGAFIVIFEYTRRLPSDQILLKKPLP